MSVLAKYRVGIRGIAEDLNISYQPTQDSLGNFAEDHEGHPNRGLKQV